MNQTAEARASAALNDRELDAVNGGVSFSEIVATGRKFLAATTLAGHFGDYLSSKNNTASPIAQDARPVQISTSTGPSVE